MQPPILQPEVLVMHQGKRSGNQLLYHERREIGSAYFALRHTLFDGHALRSGDRPSLEQETWALLTRYLLMRMAMVTAIETRPGTDPDRASLTTAMEAAKDQLTAA